MAGIFGGGDMSLADLSRVDPPKTCRYHTDTLLVTIPGEFAALAVPPYPVIHNVASPYGAQDRVSPPNVKVFFWYCPKCSYCELHYR